MQFRNRFTLFLSLLILISGITLCNNALAADSSVEVQMSGNQVAWSSAIQFQEASLTVGLPDGSFFKRSFQPGASLDFSILDAGDAQDGLYTWELTFSPVISSSDRDSMVRTDANAEAGAARRNDILPSAETLKGSGHFRVAGGSLVNSVAVEEAFVQPEAAEKSASGTPPVDRDVPARDQVILDDLIVDGSICAGFDCVNGESFGFDTIRMKENNLRLKAQDTSTSASFPTNDWQLTFNDSSNGGANKFSIDDIDGGRTPFTIEAGAPSHSLYVEDGGRVGFGTNTPVVDLHVKSGNTPTLRLEQDGSSGFGAQTWDVAGNEANFFIRDASNGSTLPFRIFPGAPSNALTIEGTTGDVGIGTTSPSAPLHVLVGGAAVAGLASHALILQNNANTTDGAIVSIISGNANTAQLTFGDADNNFIGRFLYQHSDDSMDIQVNGADHTSFLSSGADAVVVAAANGAHLTTGGVWTDTSSREYKTNIRELSSEDAAATLEGLQPMRYNYKVDLEEEFVGFIAEDVPDLVATANRKGLSSMDIVAVLTKVVQAQQETVNELTQRLAILEAQATASQQ